MFPTNPDNPHNSRLSEKCEVNFVNTENYKKSTVPYCQRLLNEDQREQEEQRKARVARQEQAMRQEEVREGGGASR